MSYSRWIDSKFYTYWRSNNDVYNKEDEIFICHTDIERYYGFTYIECKKYIEDTVSVKGRINEIDDNTEAKELTSKSYKELIRRMNVISDGKFIKPNI